MGRFITPRLGRHAWPASAASHQFPARKTNMTTLPEPIARGDLCGRRAGDKFRIANEQGKPLSGVIAVRPKDMREARKQAYEMVGDPDEKIRDSGRFWIAYYDAFAQAFPDFWRFC
jgi:hypothetical protein